MPTTPHLDPRIRRTRQLLMQALTELLAEKSFDELSVHNIAERATLSRATFYDHFPDKFALLEFMIGESFHELQSHRCPYRHETSSCRLPAGKTAGDPFRAARLNRRATIYQAGS